MKKKVFIAVFSIAICIVLVLFAVKKVSTDKNYYENITISEFEKKLENKENFAIYIYKTDCVACQTFRPIINKVLREQKVTLYAINIAEEENNKLDFFEKYNIQVTPRMMNYYKGTLTKSFDGVQSEKKLEKFLYME